MFFNQVQLRLQIRQPDFRLFLDGKEFHAEECEILAYPLNKSLMLYFSPHAPRPESVGSAVVALKDLGNFHQTIEVSCILDPVQHQANREQAQHCVYLKPSDQNEEQKIRLYIQSAVTLLG